MTAQIHKTIPNGAARLTESGLHSSRGDTASQLCKNDVAEPEEVCVSALISFFELLDRWDREAKDHAKTM
jgi:hypothetical protein